MINLRQATANDARFIARMILMALHIEPDNNNNFLSHMQELVEDERTLYHWSRCVIATTGQEEERGKEKKKQETQEEPKPLEREEEGKPIGICLAYNGEDYHERRLYSFSFTCSDGLPVAGGDNTHILKQPDESGSGEFYVDSLAVLPEYRGHGIGRTLVYDAVSRGKRLGLTPTILVDPENTPAVKLYQSVGFRFKEKMFVFGQYYDKYSC